MSIVETTAKSAEAYRTISEVADGLGVPQHVLRFWESKFTAIKPLKRSGNRRYYRPQDVAVIRTIQRLLHEEGYTIKGAQQLIRAKGMKSLVGAGNDNGVEVVEVEVAPVAAAPAVAVATVDTTALIAELSRIRDDLRGLAG